MADMNVTPLVDVMLVLLIVFMITMPVLTHSIPIQLPTASEAAKPKDESKEPLRLAIDVNGKYFLGEKETALADLDDVLKEAKAKNTDVVLAVDADKDVSYDAVVQALNAAKDAGVSKVGFITEEKAK
ncbi:biopolymer transporter ExbD [Neisseria sp. 83E34]|uniref:ExbD/TolR family protein n=1 Tax=Neisseria sp. 83E34 TaxID=1692264 RepID=UPI0006CE9175|nr:biopolymer transporter ExbD [Neisseria sp. 83E34]KPN72023.1 biopolymer transporter ExbD [Neisseria sp. 83E34]